MDTNYILYIYDYDNRSHDMYDNEVYIKNAEIIKWLKI